MTRFPMLRRKPPLPSAIELAKLAALIGPKEAPLTAVKNAMTLYLRALAERSRIAAMDQAELMFNFCDVAMWDQWFTETLGNIESLARRHYPGRDTDDVRTVLKQAGFEWKRSSSLRTSFENWFNRCRKGLFDDWWNSHRHTDEAGDHYVALDDETLGSFVRFMRHEKRESSRERTARHRAANRVQKKSASPKG